MALDIKDLKNINLDFILKLPLSKKVMILGGVWLVVAGIYGYLLYYPKMTESKNLQAKIAGLQKEVDNESVTASQLPKIKKEREEFKAQLAQALTQMPNEKEIPNLLSSISSSGRESGLDILSFKPAAESSKGFYAEVPVDMKVQGGYENVFLFFEKIAKLQRIVNIGKLNLGDAKDVKGNIVLSADFKATTFRFIGEEEAAKAAEKDKKGKK
ncbi:MAG: type 4a pilus biogenesis protein PilO [Deltaproteobacteria bacterium]|nr:type 4a pilus biogenesis protein PilO [Deltaproteobacteria bacterium]